MNIATMLKTLGKCATVIDMIGKKWSFHVIAILHHSPRRFNKISQILPQISPTNLSIILKKMSKSGIIWRDGDLYTLTPFGEEIAMHIVKFVNAVYDVSKKCSSGD